MNNLKEDFDTFLVERVESLINHLRNNNAQYFDFINRTQLLLQNLESNTNSDTWLEIKELLKAYETLAYAKGKYLYSKGLLDSATLSCYLDNEVIESDFIKPIDSDILEEI